MPCLESMSKKRRLSPAARKLAMLIAIAAILLFWQMAAWTLPDFLMLGVPKVLVRVWHDIQTAEFRAILAGRMGRLGVGYGFALLFVIGSGLAWGMLVVCRSVLKFATFS